MGPALGATRAETLELPRHLERHMDHAWVARLLDMTPRPGKKRRNGRQIWRYWPSSVYARWDWERGRPARAARAAAEREDLADMGRRIEEMERWMRASGFRVDRQDN